MTNRLSGNRVARTRMLVLLALASSFVLTQGRPALAADPIEVGFRDFGYPVNTAEDSLPTGEKPEHKLWYNDNTWWASMWSTAGSEYRIHRLDFATQEWGDTGVALDDRQTSKADVLWDDTAGKLYVVSHIYDDTAGNNIPGGDPGRVYRYSYDGVTETYTLDPAFPVSITNGTSETLTIAKDGLGTLWATWTADHTVWVNHTVGGNDLAWATPYALPTTNAISMNKDDISSVVSYDGHVGIMWSNQDVNEVFFAVHADADADTVWTEVSVFTSADDHMNLAALPGAAPGTNMVFAAIKTGQSANVIALLVCKSTATNCGDASDWSSHSVYSGFVYKPTRPMLVLDSSAREVHVFSANEEVGPPSRESIFKKTSSLDTISFDSAANGEVFIRSQGIAGGDPEDAITDATSTKQAVTTDSGLVVLANDKGPRTYFHGIINPCAGTCDDGLSCTIDTCDEFGGCVNSPVHIVCADGTICTDDVCTVGVGCENPPNAVVDCDDGVGCTISDKCTAGVCGGTPTDSACDDGLFCTGTETCDAVLDCQAGTAPACEDTVDCTDNVCDAGSDACTNPPNHGLCQNGVLCDGAEVCDPVSGCGFGPAETCDDGIGCTVDFCDVIDDECENTLNDSLCDNGVFCDGAEYCHPVSDCVTVAGPDCDDDVGCTDDVCDPGLDACINPANNANCDNGVFCDGAEFCDKTTDCNAGTPPQVDDGVSCTIDVCDEGANAVINAPDDSLCENGLFCDGVAVCHATQDCLFPGFPCDDGNVCTRDECREEVGCYYTGFPDDTCKMPRKTAIKIRDPLGSDGDVIKWRWLQGEQTLEGELGNPLTETTYTLCMYDTTGGATELKSITELPPNNNWLDKGKNGLAYKDRFGGFSGIQQLRVKTGFDSKSKITLKAQGPDIALPAPVAGDQFFGQEPLVTLQLHNSEGACWTSYWGNSIKNRADMFQAVWGFGQPIPATTTTLPPATTTTVSTTLPPTTTTTTTTTTLLSCNDPGDCFDGNVCTDDICNASNACENPKNANACDDGLSCTIGDQCAAGVCGGTPDDGLCDDLDVCTIDTCDPVLDCIYDDQCAGDDVTIEETSIGSACSGTSSNVIAIPGVTVANRSNSILVLMVGGEEDNDDCDVTHPNATATYGGVAMTPAVAAVSDLNSWRNCAGMYYLLDPPAGTADVVFTFADDTGNTINSRQAGVVQIYNALQQAPEVIAPFGVDGADNPIANDITTLSDGAMVIDAIVQGNKGDFTTTEPGQTLIWTASCSSGSSAGSAKTVVPAGTSLMGWDHSDPKRYAHTLAAFAPAPLP